MDKFDIKLNNILVMENAEYTSGFALIQPSQEFVLHCAHAPDCTHWYRLPGTVTYKRPDASLGESKWALLCAECYGKERLGVSLMQLVTGDVYYGSSLPVIRSDRCALLWD